MKKQDQLNAYPEGLLHTEQYPENHPYRADIFSNGNSLIAKVYGNTKEEAEANAQRIVKAVNSFDQMREALGKCLQELKFSLANQGAVLGFSADRINTLIKENSLVQECQEALKDSE